MRERFYAQAIFHNGLGRGSRVIMFFTRSEVSHESIRFVNVPDELAAWAFRMYGKKWKNLGLNPVITRDHEFESIQGKGVHHKAFIPSNNQWWEDFEHNEDQAVIMFKEACSKVGEKYDWNGIWNFITRGVKHALNKWFCSEFGCHVRRKAGIITQNTPDNLISPRWSKASIIFTNVRKPTT